MTFSVFYQHGGTFMHVISLLAIAAGAILVRRGLRVRRAFHSPSLHIAALGRRDILTPTLAVAMVMAGVLGSTLGFVELCAALRTVPEAQWGLAASRGGEIAVYTTVWGLMLAIPTLLAWASLGQVELRLRAIGERSGPSNVPSST